MSRVLRRGLAMATTRPPKDPLVVVIGATGTGKSKLAVELATQFNGEIINGDAMQMYQGLPIITNKISEDERKGIPHHLFDFIRLEEKPWTVKQFVTESSRVIREIRSRGRLPILVGGTHYYTHALLFKDATLGTGQDPDDEKDALDNLDSSGVTWPILSAPTEEIMSKLQEVDPVMAGKWHPRDRRKIQRSLEIWLRTGRKPSDVYTEQQQNREQAMQSRGVGDADVDTGGLRFPSLLIWLEAEDQVLKERLNKRVDEMIDRGLCQEASAMSELETELEEKGISVDQSKGIWVSIGYKELQPWVTLGPDADPATPTAQKVLLECTESVKAGTRRYAKRQTRYIRIRLASELRAVGSLDQLFLLDATDLHLWEQSVEAQSRSLVRDFLEGLVLPPPGTLSVLAKDTFEAMSRDATNGPNRLARHCEVCDKTLMTEKEWKHHLLSRTHKKTVQSQSKRQSHVQGELDRASNGNKPNDLP